MDQEKLLIRSLREENISQRKFVPDHALHCLVSDEFIYRALEKANVASVQRTEVARKIAQGGKKIFAILILDDKFIDIFKFIESDELHDTKLPFKLDALRSELKMSDPEQFEERQWEFLTPTFVRGTLNRCFRDRIILPFVIKEEVAKGAFGTVYRLKLHAEHQTPQDSFPREVSIYVQCS